MTHTKTVRLVKTSGFADSARTAPTGETAEIEVVPFYAKISFWLPVLGVVGSFVASLQGIFPEVTWPTTILLVIQAIVSAFNTTIPSSAIVK